MYFQFIIKYKSNNKKQNVKDDVRVTVRSGYFVSFSKCIEGFNICCDDHNIGDAEFVSCKIRKV